MRVRSIILVTAFLAVLAFAGILTQQSFATAKQENEIRYKVKADNGRLIRKVLNDPTSFVDGIAAEPVDSFVWDGDEEGVKKIKGSATLDIDPINNTGEIKARWEDDEGNKWKYKQTVFTTPPHATGVRIGSSKNSIEEVALGEDPVTTNVYLHGDTGSGGPVLPTLFQLISIWGPAEVTLNGKPFNNPFDGPTPLWAGHTMTSVGARQDDGSVATVDGGIFNPGVSGQGDVDNDDLEFHIVFHDAPSPEQTDNIPPPLSFFYHVMFEDVSVEIKHRE